MAINNDIDIVVLSGDKRKSALDFVMHLLNTRFSQKFELEILKSFKEKEGLMILLLL